MFPIGVIEVEALPQKSELFLTNCDSQISAFLFCYFYFNMVINLSSLKNKWHREKSKTL